MRQAWTVVEPSAEFIDGWHLDAVCEHLEAVSRGQIRQLIINIPPGHMKSLLVSVFWPAWVWTWKPEWRGLFSSHVGALAIRDSVRCRAVIESPWYQEAFSSGWSLSTDQNVKSFFQNTRMGFRLSLSVGSGTGFRGNAVVVDDPNNVMDAYSKAARDETIRWWDQTMSNRVNDARKDAFLVIQQRVHKEDLTGHLLEQGGYEHLCLPSEFVPGRRAHTGIDWADPRTAPGELLFPKMFPVEVLAEAKVKLGSTGYAGQHGQQPAADEGNIFKREWWKRYDKQPIVFEQVVLSWDCAFKDEDDSDYVVGGAIGVIGANKYLLEVDRARRNVVGTCQAIEAMRGRWPQTSAIYIEDKANGPAVMQLLQEKVPGLIAVNPEGGKVSRARAVEPEVEAGNWHLPQDNAAPWVGVFVDELASFPNDANDDQVDMFTQAGIRLRRPATTFLGTLLVPRASGRGTTM